MNLEALPEPTGWPSDACRDRFIGDWFLYQRRGGHRTSTDDLLTAWFGVRAMAGQRPSRYLDLGCGIGSVLLMVAHRLRPALCVGVEAQAQSALMAKRTVAELSEAPRVEVHHADLRELAALQLAPFQLITASPPYFPLGTGELPADPQRRACRFELRGGVEAYCAAAAPLLAPGGALALVFPSAGDSRVRAAAEQAGLKLRALAEVGMRAGRGLPFLSLYELRHEPGPLERRAFCVRDAEGAITAEYRAVRGALGFAS